MPPPTPRALNFDGSAPEHDGENSESGGSELEKVADGHGAAKVKEDEKDEKAGRDAEIQVEDQNDEKEQDAEKSEVEDNTNENDEKAEKSEVEDKQVNNERGGKRKHVELSPKSKAAAAEVKKQKHRESSARWHAKWQRKGVPREGSAQEGPAEETPEGEEAPATAGAEEAPASEETAGAEEAPASEETAGAEEAPAAEEYQHPEMPTPVLSPDSMEKAR